MEKDISKILEHLKEELPYKWKIQTKPKTDKKGACVAYIDSRDVQDVLDKNCVWQSDFYESKWKLFCRISILTDDGWISRSDSWFLENKDIDDWTESKWEVSDTFKRAAVQWGIWRFLYSKDIQWVTLEEYNSNKYKLTEYINSKNGNGTYVQQSIEKSQEDTRAWFNEKELDEFKKVKGNYSNAEEALRVIKKKYRISKVNSDLVTLLYI